MILLTPQWSTPHNIKAYSTFRYADSGQSQGLYDNFNLGLHVGDDDNHVKANREYLIQKAHLPYEPKWINQTHSTNVILAEKITEKSIKYSKNSYDASYTQQKNIVCAIMTADCLPILVTNKTGTEIAAIHAGWRGLASGIIENTLSVLHSKPDSLIIWIGPSISKAHYEIGEDVYDAFATQHTFNECEQAFKLQKKVGNTKKWLADMPLLATQRLIRLGVNTQNIYLSNECTYANVDRYFSYRRDGVTGRMVSLIWID